MIQDQLNISGEKIEELQNLASQNLFMHAQQINDWAGNLKIFVKGNFHFFFEILKNIFSLDF